MQATDYTSVCANVCVGWSAVNIYCKCELCNTIGVAYCIFLCFLEKRGLKFILDLLSVQLNYIFEKSLYGTKSTYITNINEAVIQQTNAHFYSIELFSGQQT